DGHAVRHVVDAGEGRTVASACGSSLEVPLLGACVVTGESAGLEAQLRRAGVVANGHEPVALYGEIAVGEGDARAGSQAESWTAAAVEQDEVGQRDGFL